jgi:hypothetical protein
VQSVVTPSSPTTYIASYALQPSANRPPDVANPGPQSSFEGDLISLFIQATDPDGDTLIFSAGGLPAGLSIDPDTGEISGSPGPGSASLYTVDVSVSDGFEIVDISFEWTVTAPPNQAPSADAQALQTAFETALPITLTGSDPDRRRSDVRRS